MMVGSSGWKELKMECGARPLLGNSLIGRRGLEGSTGCGEGGGEGGGVGSMGIWLRTGKVNGGA